MSIFYVKHPEHLWVNINDMNQRNPKHTQTECDPPLHFTSNAGVTPLKSIGDGNTNMNGISSYTSDNTSVTETDLFASIFILMCDPSNFPLLFRNLPLSLENHIPFLNFRVTERR